MDKPTSISDKPNICNLLSRQLISHLIPQCVKRTVQVLRGCFVTA
uniref:Uncharacterized protein n=1 Tax=Anguilla anguilla TaxID=7936 RepID=A0A0E9TGY5_ANGAN